MSETKATLGALYRGEINHRDAFSILRRLGWSAFGAASITEIVNRHRDTAAGVNAALTIRAEIPSSNREERK